MPISKAKMRERKRRDRERARQASLLGVQGIMCPADVRAMRRAGIDPEYIESEAGKVSSSVFYALMRDRDAVKAHLDWLRSSGGYNSRKTETIKAMKAIQDRIVSVEGEWVLRESEERTV